MSDVRTYCSNVRRDSLSRTIELISSRWLSFAALPFLALPLVGHSDSAKSGKSPKVEEITVIGNSAGFSTNALGFDLSPQAVPATINIIPSDLWQASGARTLDDMLQFVPSVNLNDNGGWTGDALVIRGFATSLPFRDGMRSVSSYGQSLRVMQDNIDRVEIIKGPSSTDFGVAEPGGIINLVTKKPRAEFAGSGTVKFGEDGYRRISAETTGAITESEHAQGLLVLAYEEPPEWRRGRPQNTYRYLLAPSINWDINSKASVLFSYEKVFQKSPQDRGIIYLKNAWPGDFAPRDWSFHQTSSNQENETDRLSITTKVEITKALEVTAVLERQIYQYNLQEFRNAETEPGWGDLYASDGLSWSGESATDLLWSVWNGEIPSDSAKIFFDYDLGMHKFKLGFDDYSSKAKNRYDSYTITNTFDIFAPVNDQIPDITSYDGIYTDTIKTDETGVSLRWLAEWTQRFRTVVGARTFDFEYSYQGYDGGEPDWKDSYGASETSVRLGASYDLSGNFTFFTGISDGYVPQSGMKRSLSPVESIHDTAVEVGIKSQFFNGQINWVNSVYQTTRDKLTVADPSNNILENENFLINAGKAKIRGFESELTGDITPNWSIHLGAAVMDSEILENDIPDFEGNQFGNTPRHQFTLLTTYIWGDVGIGELSTDFGVTRIGDRWGNAGNTIKLPAYNLVNLGVGLEIWEDTSVNLTATNLTDETYYTGMQNNNAAVADQVMLGSKRNISLAITHKF